MDYKKSELVKILGKEDAEWYDNSCKIPLRAPFSEWVRLHNVQTKIEKATASGKLKPIVSVSTYVLPKVMFMTDDMNHTLNPADGKMYDSKSAYYRAVKDKGLEIVGNDAPTKPLKPKQAPINWEKAVAETINQTPRKGR